MVFEDMGKVWAPSSFLVLVSGSSHAFKISRVPHFTNGTREEGLQVGAGYFLKFCEQNSLVRTFLNRFSGALQRGPFR